MTQAVAKGVQDEGEEKEPIKVSFSLPQITGGALAAATAAAIGSQLGVAGTILGAAVASVIGGIAGTLYSAGIDRTHRKVSDAIVRGYDRVRHDPDYDPARPAALAADGSGAGPTAPDGPTAVLPGLSDGVFRAEGDATAVLPTAAAAAAPERRERGRSRVGKVMLLSVAAIFVVALAAITVVELGLGRALGGGEGTTVSQVVKPSRASAKPAATPSASDTATPTPTPTASDTPTPTPTPSASDTPSASATPTAGSASTPAASGTSAPADPAQPSG